MITKFRRIKTNINIISKIIERNNKNKYQMDWWFHIFDYGKD